MGFPFVRNTPTGTQVTVAGTSVFVTRESVQGVNIGDLIILKGSYLGNSTPSTTEPSCIRRGFQANGTIVTQVLFVKYADASDLIPHKAYKIDFTASTTPTFGVIVVANVPPGLDLATLDFIQSTGTSNAPTTATLTVTCPDSLLLNFVATVGVSSVTQPAGFTQQVNVGSTVGAPTTVRCEIASKEVGEGLTGTLVSSIATSQAWVSGALAIPSPDYPAFRSATTGTASTTTNATTLKPTGLKAGDAFLLVQELEATTPANFGLWPHPGFTLVADQVSGGTRVAVYRKTADLIDQNTTPSYVVSRSEGTATMTVHCLAIRNPRPSPIGAFDIKALASTATPATNAITTQLANALLLAVFSQVGSNTATAPTGMTERTDSVGMETATRFQGTQGTTGTKQATYTGAAVSIAGLIEILSPTSQLSSAAWDATKLWGAPPFYWPDPAPEWDASLYYSPNLYPMTGAAVGGAPQLLLLGVG